MTEEQYVLGVEALKLGLEPRILKLMESWRQEYIDAGFTVTEITDLSCDDYEWVFSVENAKDGPVDIMFEIHESLAYEDTVEGVNFGMTLLAHDGTIIGSFAPYNFTADVWVALDDLAEIDRRLALLEGLDLSDTITPKN